MDIITTTVVSFLACIYNKNVRQAILKNYELKFAPLTNIKNYISQDEFKSKVIDENNFDQCVNFAIQKMEDEKFRDYLAKSDICSIVFYKKEIEKPKNLLNDNSTKSSSILSTLKSLMIKYDIDGENIIIYTNPVASYKKRILDAKEDIINHFKNHGKNVSNVIVKYIYKDTLIDEDGEALLEIGFTIK